MVACGDLVTPDDLYTSGLLIVAMWMLTAVPLAMLVALCEWVSDTMALTEPGTMATEEY